MMVWDVLLGLSIIVVLIAIILQGLSQGNGRSRRLAAIPVRTSWYSRRAARQIREKITTAQQNEWFWWILLVALVVIAISMNF